MCVCGYVGGCVGMCGVRVVGRGLVIVFSMQKWVETE